MRIVLILTYDIMIVSMISMLWWICHSSSFLYHRSNRYYSVSWVNRSLVLACVAIVIKARYSSFQWVYSYWWYRDHLYLLTVYIGYNIWYTSLGSVRSWIIIIYSIVHSLINDNSYHSFLTNNNMLVAIYMHLIVLRCFQ